MNPASPQPVTRVSGDVPSVFHIIPLLAIITALVLAGLALAAHLGWLPAPPGLNLRALLPPLEAQVLKGACGRCGMIEAIDVVDARRSGSIHLGLTGPAAVQQAGAPGQDLSSALALVMIALVAQQQPEPPSPVYAVTVRFEDGSGRMFTDTSLPAWQPGDRVKVVNGRILPLQ